MSFSLVGERFRGSCRCKSYLIATQTSASGRQRELSDQFKSQIIVGSTREVLNVIEWLEAGAHIVTVSPDLLKGMLVHPYSKETVQMFLRDAAKAEAMLQEAIPVRAAPTLVG